MTLTALSNGPWFEYLVPNRNLTSAIAVVTLMSGADVDQKAAFIIQCPYDGVLEGIAWPQPTFVAGTNTKRVSFQDLDTSGFPDGGADQFRVVTPTAVSAATSGIMSSDGTDTGTKRTVVRGQLLAIVFDFTAYTSGSWNINAQSITRAGEWPYCAIANTSGTWSKSSAALLPAFNLKYFSGPVTQAYVVMPQCAPVLSAAGLTFNSTSAVDEIALRFKVDRAIEVIGVTALLDMNDDFTIRLMDGLNSSPNILATLTADKDQVGAAVALGWDEYIWDNAVTLAANTVYRIAIRPDTATSSIIAAFNVNGNGELAGVEGGIECYYSERADAGTWSDVTTRRPIIGLLVSKVDDGTGGSSPGTTNLATRLTGGVLAG